MRLEKCCEMFSRVASREELASITKVDVNGCCEEIFWHKVR